MITKTDSGRWDWELLPFFENASDLIAIISSEGVMSLLNPAFETISGWGTSEWLGKDWEIFVHPDDHALFEGQLEKAKEKKSSLFEFRLLTKSGSFRHVEASLSPIERAGAGFLAVVRDISERKKNDEERRRFHENERSSKEIDQFTYICSHDMQEPLRIVVSFAQLFKRRYHGKLDGEADEILSHMVQGAKKMSRLVHEVLAYSRLGAQAMHKELVDSRQVLKEVLQKLEGETRSASGTITFEALPQITADRSGLRDLLENLIGNALKFRGKRAPLVHVSAVKVREEWVFSVRDNGIGFEMQYADRIFAVFKRLHHTEEYPGSGMGLALCKRIVERHGGRIWVQSQVDEGSSFFFSLPAVNNVASPTATSIIVEKKGETRRSPLYSNVL